MLWPLRGYRDRCNSAAREGSGGKRREKQGSTFTWWRGIASGGGERHWRGGLGYHVKLMTKKTRGRKNTFEESRNDQRRPGTHLQLRNPTDGRVTGP